MSSAAELAIESGLEHPHTAVFHTVNEDPGKIRAITNTAAILANTGLQVLLIDMDLHSPGLTDPFDTPLESRGVVEYLDDRYFCAEQPDKEVELSELVIPVRFTDSPLSSSVSLLPAANITSPRYGHVVADGNYEVMFSLPEGFTSSNYVSQTETGTFRNLTDEIWGRLTDDVEALSPRPDVVLVAATSGIGPLAWETIGRFGKNLDARVVSVVNSLRTPLLRPEHMAELLAKAGIVSDKTMQLDVARELGNTAEDDRNAIERCRRAAEFIVGRELFQN